MAEVNTAEVEAKVNAAFGAGFGDTPPAPAEKVVETPAPEAAKPAPKAEPKASTPVVAAPEKPQYVRLTKQEWDNAKAATGKVAALESQVAKFGGEIAKLAGATAKTEQNVAQVLEGVRAKTGIKVDTKKGFARLAASYPELAADLAEDLNEIFEAAQTPAATAATPPAQPVDVDAAFKRLMLEREADLLAEAYPDWQDRVGKPKTTGGAPDETVDFRKWLATKEPAYQQKIATTVSPGVLQSALDLHAKETTQTAASSAAPAKPDRAAARRAVIEDAVTPRAEGNPPPLNQPMSAEDAFAQSFKAAKRQ